MGNFYVNFSIKGAEPRHVADVLEKAGRVAIVTPRQVGYVVVYDKEADRQAIPPILEVGGMLSRELGLPVLAVLNHDDDILACWLFERGELADAYNANLRPGALVAPCRDGDPAKLCAALRPDADASAVEAILRGPVLLAVDRHLQLAKALRLPSWSVGLGYDYAAAGELDVDLNEVESLIRVGGPM